MSGIDRARLKEILNEKNRSARDVSLKSGLGDSAVKQILNGVNKKPSLDALLKIAAEIDVPLTDFADLDIVTGVDPIRRRQVVPAYLPVRYKVAAGVWLALDEYAQEYPEPPQAVVPDGRYAEWPQWLELIEGASMNEVMLPGTYAHVVDALEMGYAPAAGDFVVVERRRMGGELRERTCKEVRLNGRGVELWPRSTDAKYQEPLILADSDETTEIQIVGKVIGSYQSFARGNEG